MKTGSMFEGTVAEMLAVDRLELIQKAEPASNIIKPLGKGKFMVTFSAGGVLDFTGSYQGQHVELDAKDIKGTRLTFSKHIKPSQLVRMREMSRDGAIMGLVVRFRAVSANDDQIVAIPAKIITDLLDEGKKGLSVGDLLEECGCVRIAYGRLTGLRIFLENFKRLQPIGNTC